VLVKQSSTSSSSSSTPSYTRRSRYRDRKFENSFRIRRATEAVENARCRIKHFGGCVAFQQAETRLFEIQVDATIKVQENHYLKALKPDGLARLETWSEYKDEYMKAFKTLRRPFPQMVFAELQHSSIEYYSPSMLWIRSGSADLDGLSKLLFSKASFQGWQVTERIHNSVVTCKRCCAKAAFQSAPTKSTA
jgi:hypothetical protein